jgi:putative nucleotidyltransferase with HDIG domain
MVSEVPEALCRLPKFRPVALKLLKLLAIEDVDFRAVGNVLSSDPAFSAEVLALANSPLYGAACATTSLTRAIIVLGLERTRSLTLTIAMQAFVANAQVTPELQNCWRHSMACALIAENFARNFGLNADHGYTAGLMHDLGRLGLLKSYGAKYADLLNGCYDDIGQVLDAERRLFQVDHCQAGLWLTRSWGFPEELQRITGSHHAVSEDASGSVRLAGTACVLADALGFPAVHYSMAEGVEEVTKSIPGLGAFDLEKLREQIAQKLQSVDLLG